MKDLLMKIYLFFSVISITYFIYIILEKIGLIKFLGMFESLFILFLFFFVIFCEIKKNEWITKENQKIIEKNKK